jgi:hypothetical protein
VPAQLQERRERRLLERALRDALPEVRARVAHAAHLEALRPGRREPLADDALGAAPADIDDQPAPIRTGDAV